MMMIKQKNIIKNNINNKITRKTLYKKRINIKRKAFEPEMSFLNEISGILLPEQNMEKSRDKIGTELKLI